MHTYDCFVKFICPVCQFIFHKGEIRYRFWVIIFQCIRIETNEFHITGNKGEVGRTEYRFVRFCPRTQTIMVSYEGYIGNTQSVHNIPLPKKFFSNSEVTHISAMNNEVDIISLIDCFYEILRFIVPPLWVAHSDKADCLFTFTVSFYLFNVMSVYICLSTDTHIIGMIVDHTTPGQKQTGQKSE